MAEIGCMQGSYQYNLTPITSEGSRMKVHIAACRLVGKVPYSHVLGKQVKIHGDLIVLL